MENEIKYIKDQSAKIKRLASNEELLFNEINNLSKDSTEFLSSQYKDSTGPLNILRLTVLKQLEQGQVISIESVQEIKNKFNQKDLNYFSPYLTSQTIENIESYKSKKGGDPFRSWGDPFRVFHTFFYNENKAKTQQYMKAIGEDMIKKLELPDYTFKIVDFTGTQNQGSTEAWIALYNKKFNRYTDCVQIFLAFEDGNTIAGIYSGSRSKTDEEINERGSYNSYSEIIEGLQQVKNKAVKINNSLSTSEDVISKKRYWMYAADEGSSKWEEFYNQGIMAIGWDNLNNLSEYISKEEIRVKLQEIYGNESSHKNSVLAAWQFANEIQIGDIIFVKKGRDKIIGRGIVESDYTYDNQRNDFKNVRKVKWTDKGDWEHPSGQAVTKALTDITQYTGYCEKLQALFEEELKEDIATDYAPYSDNDFLNEVFMTEDEYETVKNILLNKKNLILQGAPGVGKTYAAKRLAYSIIGKKDISKVKMIQFHQSYSYEDFIMGYRPSKDNSFEIKAGPFYKFCKEAEEDSENKYFFIIDEINRGNLSKIFGELLMLIESDKRGEPLKLLYKDEQFSVPKNVHIIGMMNTADRSLAMIDYALRRRFAFYEFIPAFEKDSFKDYRIEKSNTKFDSLIDSIISLNKAISADNSLGDGFRIGHSYFYTEDIVEDNWLEYVVNYEVIPLLKEYWFDEPERIKEWANKLKLAIK